MKAFEIPKDFSRKVLCVGVWGDAPTDNTTQKKHGVAVLFNLSLTVGTAFQTSFSYLSYKKGKPKNFPPNTPLHFGEAFEIPKDFSRKVLCVGVWGGSPN